MKTANNLSIKTNKHLKNDELLALRGGGELTWDGECAIRFGSVPSSVSGDLSFSS